MREAGASLAAVAGGESGALEALYDRHSGLLYSLLVRILKDPDDAQEVLQETFVKVWSSARTYDSARGSEVAWLVTVARSRAIDKLRARRTRATYEYEAGREAEHCTGLADRETGADHAIRTETQKAVHGGLAALPDAQRVPLELAYFDGLSQAEIASRLGQPLGTIKTRMQTGMRKLRGQLDRYRR